MADIKPIFEQPPQTDRLPTPFSNVPYSPLGFGAGVGGGLQQFAEAASNLYAQSLERANSARLMKEVGEFGLKADVLLHDPKVGVLNLQGEEALRAFDPAVQKLKDIQTKTEAVFPDEQQRAQFRAHSSGIMRAAVRQLYVHQADQGEKLEQLGLVTTQHSMLNSAVKAVDQPSADSYTATAADATFAYWSHRANDQVATEKKREYVAAATGARLDRLLANPDTAAAGIDLFQSRRDALPADRLDTYEKLTGALQKQREVNLQAAQVIVGATKAVPVPDGNGTQVPRVDATKLSAAVLGLPDSPNRDLVVKAIEQRQQVFDKVWNETVAQRVAAAQTQGTNAATGEFTLSKASMQDRVWLQENAPEKLIALRGLDARPRRVDSGEERTASKNALADVLLDMADPSRRGAFYGPLSAPQFNLILNDQPLTGIDRRTAIIEFKKIKAEAGKVQDTVLSVSKQTLAEAFPTQPNQAKKYLPALVQDLHQFVDTEKARNNGKAPGDAEMRARTLFMLSRPPGEHWWNSPDRRIEEMVKQSTEAAKTGTPLAPVQAATPLAPARRPTRTINGVTKEWDGSKWVAP